MDQRALTRMRLASQKISGDRLAQPADVVAWMGAMQAQDYLAALWAVGLRTPDATEDVVERALAERAIVRTWPMRGTIHFVAPADVRWMLELLAPRVVRGSQGRLRQLGLDSATIAASGDVIARALEGGKQLTREQLYAALEQAGIIASGSRGLHILGQLAHARLICFGARSGKQPTFTLLDEWVPPAAPLPRDEALATLARRYFTSHGPATTQDLMWWAGLTTAEANAGIAAAQLAQATVDGQRYHFARELEDAPDLGPEVFLLPPYDEYLVAYRDRRAALDPDHNTLVVPGGNGVFYPIVVVDGRVSGTWRRAFKKSSVVISLGPFGTWSAQQAAAITSAAERYASFHQKTLAPIVGL
jgi:Winged helix DNA-binding domain